MKWLSSLQTKRADSSGAIARATAGTLASSGSFNYTGNWDTDQAIRRGYERVIAVFRCVDAIATALSSLQLIFREDDDRTGRRVLDAQLNYVLNKRTNTYETARQFRYRLSSQLLLSTKGAFIEIIKNRAGRPAQLHLLNPEYVNPIPDPNIFVSEYEVVGANHRRYTLDPDQVIWVKLKPHPTDQYRQMTPLQAAGLSIDTDWLSRMFNRSFIQNDGRPGLLVTIQNLGNSDDAMEIKKRFGSGPVNAGQTTVIEADGLAVQDLSATPHDLQYLAGLEATKQDILLAFGTPESVLGNASGRTFDNADAERLNWYMDTLFSHGDAIGGAFDVLTVDGFNDNIYVAHDWDSVDVLQRARKEEEDRALNEYTEGTISLDEYRERTGKTPLQVPGSQVIWIPAGSIPVGRTAQITEAAQQLVAIAAQQQADGMDPQQMSDAARQGALEGWTQQQRVLANESAARAAQMQRQIAEDMQKSIQNRLATKDIVDAEIVEEKVLVDPVPQDPHAEDRLVTESELVGMLSSWSNHQEQIVNERLVSSRTRKGTRHWEGETKNNPLDQDYIVNASRWSAEIGRDFEPVLRRVVEKQMRSITRQMNKSGVIADLNKSMGGNPQGKDALHRLFSNPEATANDIVAKSISVVQKSALAQSNRLAKKIQSMDESGSSITDIKKTITQMIGARSDWKKQLATLVTTQVIEQANSCAFAVAGNYCDKKWVAHKDERTRHTHRQADGQVVAGNKKFSVGEAKLFGPGDPQGPIEEIANCRCRQELALRETA